MAGLAGGLNIAHNKAFKHQDVLQLETPFSFASTSKCLFWDVLEKYYNYIQILVKVTKKNNTQQKNWENFEILKKISQDNRQISFVCDYFIVDSAVEMI